MDRSQEEVQAQVASPRADDLLEAATANSCISVVDIDGFLAADLGLLTGGDVCCMPADSRIT